MRRQSSRSLSRPGIIDEALSLGRQATGLDQFHAAFERLPDESELGGPLPPLAPPLPVPVRRLGSALYVERRAAREHIIKSSPVLHYTESWFETLLTPQEYLPPKILYFVIGMVSLVTWGAIRYPDPTSADDRLHTTMIGFISLLIVFRTSQAYARWWEGRSLWGSIVNSTRNLASNAAIWMGDEARYMHAIICTITFAYAVKQSLRGLKLDKAEMAGLFGDDEIALLNAVEHIPMLMIDEIRRTVRVRPRMAPARSAPLLRAKPERRVGGRTERCPWLCLCPSCAGARCVRRAGGASRPGPARQPAGGELQLGPDHQHRPEGDGRRARRMRAHREDADAIWLPRAAAYLHVSRDAQGGRARTAAGRSAAIGGMAGVLTLPAAPAAPFARRAHRPRPLDAPACSG